MIRTLATKRHLLALLCVTIPTAVAGQASAEEDMFDGKWRFRLTAYLFLPKFY